MGIGRPESRDPEVVSHYVLSDMPPAEREVIQFKSTNDILAILGTLVNLKINHYSFSFSTVNKVFISPPAPRGKVCSVIQC